MYRVHTPDELHQLNYLQHKKNILVRFMMNGCPACTHSQSDWDNACKQANLSPDDAILELESNFVNQFKEKMQARNTAIEVYKFPTIMLIRGRTATEFPNRDTASILKLLKSIKKSRRVKRRKTKRTYLNRFF